MIYPSAAMDQEQADFYKKLETVSMELYDYYTNGKKANGGLRTIRNDEQLKRDSKPPWRSTGNGRVPIYTKPSKYQQNS